MIADSNSEIEKTIKDYIELREMSRLYAKKRNDLEKEYNKLLTNYNGEERITAWTRLIKFIKFTVR